MNFLKRLLGHFGHLYEDTTFVAKLEFRNIFSDKGVLMIFFGALLMYPVLYAVTYQNEVVKEVPVGVVDLSRTSTSRQLVRMLDQTETIQVAQHLTSLEEAETHFYKGDINGIVLIPSDFEKQILRGEQTSVSAYCDASYLMLYKQVFRGVSTSVGTLSAGIELKRLAAKGMPSSAALRFRDPIPVISYPLFNPSGGYSTYSMPAIFMIVLQQTLLMGIGILGGTALERGSFRYLIQPEVHGRGVAAIILGKAFPYFVIYAVHSIYLFGFLFKIFGYPQRGNVMSLVYYIFTFLLAVMAMGFALSPLFRHRETAIVTFMGISLPSVLTAGFAWPTESIPWVIKVISRFIPSTSGVNGFLKITQMGATLQDVRGDILSLWGLVALYGSCSLLIVWLIIHYQRRHPVL